MSHFLWNYTIMYKEYKFIILKIIYLSISYSAGIWMKMTHMGLHLNMCLQVGKAVWEGLWSVVCFGQIYYWGWGLCSKKKTRIVGLSLCHMVLNQDVSSHLSLCSVLIDSKSLILEIILNAFFYNLCWPWCFITTIEKKITRKEKLTGKEFGTRLDHPVLWRNMEDLETMD